MRRIPRAVAVVAGVFVVGVLVAAITSALLDFAAPLLAGMVLIAARFVGWRRKWAFFQKPASQRGVVMTTLGLAFLCVGMFGLNRDARRLAELRGTDPNTYLEQLRNRGQEDRWLAELRELDQPRYDAEMRRRAEAERLEKERQAAEVKRQAEAAEVEKARRREAEIVALQKEWTTLPSEDLARVVRVATRLAELQPSGTAPDGVSWAKKRDDATARLAVLETQRRARLNPERAVVLGTTGRRGGFGATMQVSFTINNKNDFAIKDVVIYCEARGNSGTVIQSFNKTLYEVVRAQQTLTIKNVSMGFLNEQVTSYSCEALAATAV